MQVPFFKGCDTSQVAALVPRIHTEHAWPGRPILYEAYPGRGLFMIARGFVRVTEQAALLTVLTHGDFFGEATLLSDTPARATVQARSPADLPTISNRSPAARSPIDLPQISRLEISR